MRRRSAYGLLPLAAGASVLFPGAAAAQYNPYYYQRGPHMMGEFGYGWFMGPIFLLIFIAVAVVLVVLLVRWMNASGTGVSSGGGLPAARTPLDILKERFARGEIDQKEFEERRKVLEK